MARAFSHFPNFEFNLRKNYPWEFGIDRITESAPMFGSVAANPSKKAKKQALVFWL